jgi:hypothetical protein
MRGTPLTRAGTDGARGLRCGVCPSAKLGGAGRGRQRRPCGAPGFSQTFRPARPPPPPDSRLKLFERKDGPSRAAGAPLRTERPRHPQPGTRAPAAVSSPCGRARPRLHPPRASPGLRHCATGGRAGRLRPRRPGGAGVQPNIPARASPAAPPTAAPRSWRCEGGAGPGGGRRRPPRPAPPARRAPAPALPPVSDDLPLAPRTPALALQAPPSPVELWARLGALGRGLGFRETSPTRASLCL